MQGSVHFLQKDFKRARHDFLIASRLNPNFVPARALAGYLDQALRAGSKPPETQKPPTGTTTKPSLWAPPPAEIPPQSPPKPAAPPPAEHVIQDLLERFPPGRILAYSGATIALIIAGSEIAVVGAGLTLAGMAWDDWKKGNFSGGTPKR